MEPIRNLQQKAFELACFIHQDRTLAIEIVIEAMDRRQTMAARQSKRRSYRLLGRRRLRPRRDKVILEQASLLQYLIFLESGLRELEQERRPGGARLTDEDRVVRFIEHLVRITLPRNALHVCIGMGRLLYRYSTDELAKVYDVLIQDAERYPEGDYVRARKKILIDEVIDRFGSTVRMRTGAYREKFFETRPGSESLARAVREALQMFTPWDTSCSLPADFEPSRHEISELRFDDSDPDREHAHELLRMHTILHPPCFAGLIGALGFEAPEERLAVPIFFADSTSNGDGNGNGDGDGTPSPGRRPPTPLTDPERRQIEDELNIRGSRRTAWKLGRLSVLVDGTELGTMDLPEVNHARFQLPADAGMVEVRGEHNGRPVRLATYLPGWRESMDATDSSVELELDQGQVISFVAPAAAERTGPKMIEIRYREARWLRALTFTWHRSQHRSRRGRTQERWASPTLALSRAGVAVLAAGVGLFVLLAPPGWQGLSPFPQPTQPELGAPPSNATDKAPPRTGPGDFPLRDVLRGSSDPRADVPLSEVETLHIETFGKDSRLQALHEQLVERLGGDENRFRIAAESDQADAVLRFSEQDPAGRENPGRAGVPLVLVNRGGEILWQESLHPPFEDRTEDRARRAAESLIDSARQSP